MQARDKFNPSESVVYKYVNYLIMAKAFHDLARAYDKENPVKIVQPSAILFFSLLPHVINSPWARYPSQVINAVKNPLTWIMQQSLLLATNTAMQLFWKRLSPESKKNPLVIEAAGVAQLGAEFGINKASQFVDDKTSSTWSGFIWGILSKLNPMAGNSKAATNEEAPTLGSSDEIKALEQKQKAMNAEVASKAAALQSMQEKKSIFVEQIRELINKYYDRGFFIYVDKNNKPLKGGKGGTKITDREQAIELLAAQGYNGKKHLPVYLQNRFFGGKKSTTVTYPDPSINSGLNEVLESRRAEHARTLQAAQENEILLAHARARQDVQESIRLPSITTSFPTPDITPPPISFTMILTPQPSMPTDENISALLPSSPSSSSPHLPLSALARVPVQEPIQEPQERRQTVESIGTSSSASDTRELSRVSLFKPRVQIKHAMSLSETNNILAEFKEVFNDHLGNCQKVKNGAYAGQVPRPFREMQEVLTKIEGGKCSVDKGMQEIIAIAKTLGEQHPVLRAAKKCDGVVNNYQYNSLRA